MSIKKDSILLNQAKKGQAFPTDVNFLHLEDMESFRLQMGKDLRELGIQGKIFEAPDVATALKLCQAEVIGFIISDWNLPDGTGLEFLKKIRATKKFANTPFLMCTTMDELKYLLDAISSGANDYIVKPWDIGELKKKIRLTWEMHLSKSK